MHPRNPYRQFPDFRNLAEFFPALKPHLSLSPAGTSSLNFKDPHAQRALTQALLKRDFDITLSLPQHRLCPPVPNRLNYVLWVQDILFPYDGIAPDKEITGLDIGTGASAIYPLLACSLPNAGKWTFVGTEIDPLSAEFASHNVVANNLQSRITIHKIPKTDPPVIEKGSILTPILAPLVEDSESRFDFTMCNPPFYHSTSEIESSAEAKDHPPLAVCTGAETEMITPGGETTFVLQMLQESAREDIQGRCRWFTSMLGKLASVGEVVREFRRLNVDNFALTQFIQGTTRRWAVAWSFTDERLPDAVARSSSSSLSSYLPSTTSLRQTFTIPGHRSNDAPPFELVRLRVKSALSDVLNALEGVTFHPVHKARIKESPPKRRPADGDDEEVWKLDVTAIENTWSRAARRKRKRQISPSNDTATATKTPRLDRRTSLQRPRLSPPSRRSENLNATLPSSDPLHYLPHYPALQCWISVLDPPSESVYSSQQPSESSSLSPSYRSDTYHSAHITPPGTVTLESQWTRGKERSLFEGFWSHVCRKVAEKLSESNNTHMGA